MINKRILIIYVICFVSLLGILFFSIKNRPATHIIEESKNTSDVLKVETKRLNPTFADIYNVEDKFINKSIDGEVICLKDLNCVKRFFMECKSFNGVFIDNDAMKYFIMFGKGYYLDSNKCVVEVKSSDGLNNNYSCSIADKDLSLDLFSKITNLNSRENLDFCTKIAK